MSTSPYAAFQRLFILHIISYKSKPVSRVLSWTAIYLGLRLPAGSCDTTKAWAGRPWPCCFLWKRRAVLYLVLHQTGFTCACPVAGAAVRSYRTFPPLGHYCPGLFLLHCPWSRLRRVLSGALPCDARTFLMPCVCYETCWHAAARLTLGMRTFLVLIYASASVVSASSTNSTTVSVVLVTSATVSVVSASSTISVTSSS